MLPSMQGSGDAPTRLFFAIVPDEGGRARLAELAAAPAHAAGGRASAPDTLHLTVVFVGTVRAADVATVRDAGDSVTWEAHDLALDTLGAFARAGIAWAAPARAPDALARINRGLVGELAARGVATEARPYRPHVTLARLRKGARAGPVEGGPALEPFTADEVTLYRSRLSPRGARYEPLVWRVDTVVLMSSRLLSDGPRYRPIAQWTAA